MNLVIDIGNSFIKLAIFQDEVLIHHERVTKYTVAQLKALIKKFPITKAISSNVRRSEPYFFKFLDRNYQLLRLSHKTKVPVKISYKTPKTLGLDRVAVVVGAIMAYPNRAACVIDIGTCMTFDYVDEDSKYYGGNIAPGVELRLRAMHEFTSALPLLKRKWNPELLGTSTQTAMQNGAVWGVKMEIERFIKTLTKQKGKLVTILTGGDAAYFGEIVDSKIFVDPILLLKGLNAILDYNS